MCIIKSETFDPKFCYQAIDNNNTTANLVDSTERPKQSLVTTESNRMCSESIQTIQYRIVLIFK